VAGIVAALKAHDDIGLLRQPVDDLAFTLVAPLGANHHDIRHNDLSCAGLRTLAPGIPGRSTFG